MKKLNYGRQYIDEADIEAVVRVLRSDFLTSGPEIEVLEEALCKLTSAKYCVAVSNGTAALHLACLALGIEKGDEVITSPMTFAASANCVLYCGGMPVFADINPDTWNISPESIKQKITEKTKAIIAVDFTGQTAELDEIRQICVENEIILIEDAAHAIGSTYKGKMVGSIADMTTFSFHPVKTITGGEGGAVMTNNESLYQKLRLLRTHGITREIDSKEPWYYEQVELGYNYRITDIQAALIRSQLNKLDRFAKRRKQIVDMYDEAFKNIPQLILQKEIQESEPLKHIYVLRFDLKKIQKTRLQIYHELLEKGIQCNVHYIPVYYHPYYQKLGYQKGICPNAEALYEEILTLPLYYSLTDEDVNQVIQSVKEVI